MPRLQTALTCSGNPSFDAICAAFSEKNVEHAHSDVAQTNDADVYHFSLYVI